MGTYVRPMKRCSICDYLWSVDPSEVFPCCPCGGPLVVVDMHKLAAKAPYVPMQPQSPKVK